MIRPQPVWTRIVLCIALFSLAACEDGSNPGPAGTAGSGGSGGSGGIGGTGGTGGEGGTGGSEPAVPECREAPPDCGGDPTGRWKIFAWCGEVTRTVDFGAAEDCLAQPFRQGFEVAEGHFEYRPDGTLDTDVYLEVELGYAVTPACAAYWVGQGVTGDVCRAFQQSIAANHLVVGTSCRATDDGGCDCTTTYIDDREEAIPWDLAGGVLHEDGTPVARCVKDDVLVRVSALESDGDDWITSVLVRDERDPALACEGETVECGGDPTGLWVLAGACGEAEFAAPISSTAACQDQPGWFGFDDTEGTLEYRADGTVTWDVKYELDFRVDVTPACVADLEAQLDDVCRSIAAGYARGGYTGMACAATDEGGCACTGTVRQESAGSGTWVLEDGVLVEGESVYSRCIEGDVFRRTTEPMEGGEGWVTEVLVRQAG